MSYMERTEKKTQYGMKEEVDKAKEMVKQVTTENDKDKASIIHRFLDKRRGPGQNIMSSAHCTGSNYRTHVCSFALRTSSGASRHHNSND
jgi:hypothetical protein